MRQLLVLQEEQALRRKALRFALKAVAKEREGQRGFGLAAATDRKDSTIGVRYCTRFGQPMSA